MKNIHELLLLAKARAEESNYQIEGKKVVILPVDDFIAWLDWLDRMITHPDLPLITGHARGQEKKDADDNKGSNVTTIG